MKPISLTISGVKSFCETQVIDFETLIKGGIFGIFGDTGSGKSTILDCITYALYGDFKPEFINQRCDKAHIEFVFEIFYQSERKKYLITRTFYRKSTPTKSSMAEIVGETIRPFAEKVKEVNLAVEKIIGLTQSEFESCIVLPQGKFDKFITATRTPRIQIIQNLFSLDKYGDKLKDVIIREKNNYSLKISELQGQRNALGDIDEEVYNSVRLEYEHAKTELKNIDKIISKNADYIAKYKIYYDTYNRLIETKETIKNLEQKEDYYYQLNKVFEVFDKIENIVKLGDNLNNKIFAYNDGVKHLEDINSKTALLEEEILSLTKKVNDFDAKYNEIKDNLIQNQAKLPFYQEKQVLIQNLNKEVNDLRVKYKSADVKLNKVLLEIEDYSNKLKRFGTLDENVDKLCSIKESEVYSEFVDYLNILIEFTSGKATESIVEKISKYTDIIAKYKDNSYSVEEIVNILKDVMNYGQNLVKLTSDKKILEDEKSTCLESGKLLANQISELESEIKAFTGGEPISVYEDKIKRSITLLETQKIAVHNDFDEKVAQREKLATTKNEIKTSVEIAFSEIEFIKNSLNAQYFDDYKSVEIAKTAYDKYKPLLAEREIAKEYVSTLAHKKSELNNLIKTLNASDFDAEVYKETLQNQEEIAKNREEIKTNFVKIEEKLKNTSQNYNKLCIINNTFNDLSRERELLIELDGKALSNKLLEFVADEYLKEITELSKKTLYTLSSGKYSIKYDGEFFIVDNLNGGALRPVRTLSGGETFIVSLSLALALSTEIHAKSMRPIEFFFLDEGFGTLDKNLTDTVVSSLLKLKNSHFSIGLISHVEELKEAVSSRLDVAQATAFCGSKVKITSL